MASFRPLNVPYYSNRQLSEQKTTSSIKEGGSEVTQDGKVENSTSTRCSTAKQHHIGGVDVTSLKKADEGPELPFYRDGTYELRKLSKQRTGHLKSRKGKSFSPLCASIIQQYNEVSLGQKLATFRNASDEGDHFPSPKSLYSSPTKTRHNDHELSKVSPQRATPRTSNQRFRSLSHENGIASLQFPQKNPDATQVPELLRLQWDGSTNIQSNLRPTRRSQLSSINKTRSLSFGGDLRISSPLNRMAMYVLEGADKAPRLPQREGRPDPTSDTIAAAASGYDSDVSNTQSQSGTSSISSKSDMRCDCSFSDSSERFRSSKRKQQRSLHRQPKSEATVALLL
jgi:hypothetical protein